MADTGWFFFSGQARRGPFAMERLVSELSCLPNPQAATVWREGMSGWVPAGDVPEIAAKLPPPLEDQASTEVRAVSSGLSITLGVFLGFNVAIGLLRILVLLPGLVTPGASGLNLNALEALDAIGLLAFLPTAFLFITWVYQATAAISSWPGVKPRFSPPWNTIAYWFIPFIFLFRPYQAVVDVWQHSLRAAAPRGGGKPPGSDQLVQSWWTAWIACAVLGAAVRRMPAAAAATSPLSTVFLLLTWQIAFVAAGTAAGVVILTVMRAHKYATAPAAMRPPSGITAPAPAIGWLLGAGSLAAACLGFIVYLAAVADAAAPTRTQRATSVVPAADTRSVADPGVATPDIPSPSPSPAPSVDLRSIEYRWSETGGRVLVQMYNGSDKYIEAADVQVMAPSGAPGLRYRLLPVPTDVDRFLADVLPPRDSSGGICGSRPKIAPYTSGDLVAQVFEPSGPEARLRLLDVTACVSAAVARALPPEAVSGMPFRWSMNGKAFELTVQNNQQAPIKSLLVEITSPEGKRRRYWAYVSEGVGMSVLQQCPSNRYSKAVPAYGVGKFAGTAFDDIVDKSQMRLVDVYGCQ